MNRLTKLFILVALFATPAVAQAQETHIFLQGRPTLVWNTNAEEFQPEYTGLEELYVGRAMVGLFHITSSPYWNFEVNTGYKFTPHEKLELTPGPVISFNKFDGWDDPAAGVNVAVRAFDGLVFIPVLRVLWNEGEVAEKAIIANVNPGEYRLTAQTFNDAWKVSAGRTIPDDGPVSVELRGLVKGVGGDFGGFGLETRFTFFR